MRVFSSYILLVNIISLFLLPSRADLNYSVSKIKLVLPRVILIVDIIYTVGRLSIFTKGIWIFMF